MVTCACLCFDGLVCAYGSNVVWINWIGHRIYRHHHDLKYSRRPPNAVPALTDEAATEVLVPISAGGDIATLAVAAIERATSAVISSIVTDDASDCRLALLPLAFLRSR